MTCCVRGCIERYSILYRFPKDYPEIFEMWTEIIKPVNYELMSPEEIYKKYYVCEKHFSKDCWVQGTKRLIRTAIPSLLIQRKYPSFLITSNI